MVSGLISLAWFNGTFWHELHGREDGRSRNYIFFQMGLLALLAVFASEATESDGREFAISYSILFALFTWQWYQVQRIDDRRYRPTTRRYLAGMLASVALMLASGFAGGSVRTAVWVAGVTIAASALPAYEFPPGMGRYIAPAFGLAAVVTLAIGAARPAPIVLVTSVSAVLLVAWLGLFMFFLALGGDPKVEEPASSTK